MTGALRRRLARAVTSGGACVVLGACASVLGVDKNFVLAPPDAGFGADAGAEASGAPPTGILCALGAGPCQAGAQECCLTSTLSCVSAAPSDPCPGGTDIPCDDPSDCTNPDLPVCCIALDSANAILSTVCAKECASSSNQNVVELCALQGAACAGGTQCEPLTVHVAPPSHSPWFYSCQ